MRREGGCEEREGVGKCEGVSREGEYEEHKVQTGVSKKSISSC